MSSRVSGRDPKLETAASPRSAQDSAYDRRNREANARPGKFDLLVGTQDAVLGEGPCVGRLAEDVDLACDQVDQPVDGDSGGGVDPNLPSIERLAGARHLGH